MFARFFTLDELTRSGTATDNGIDNVPTGVVLERLRATAQKMDGVRLYLNRPVIVTSGYRSPALNRLIPGAVDTSHHTQGYAVDFVSPLFGTPYDICVTLRDSGIRFDQLIQEHGRWVHISFAPSLRQECLTARKNSAGKTYYVAGIHAR